MSIKIADDVSNDFSLFGTNFTLLKAAHEADAQDPSSWKVGGIASSESMDEQGEILLREILDISYLQKRGYINWSHSRAPQDQIGVITQAQILSSEMVSQVEDKLGVPIPTASSLYVEGVLYKNVPAAKSVYDIMSSLPVGVPSGLGFSVEGVVAINDEGRVLKAIIRGVAVTPSPAQVETLCTLIKSISSGRKVSNSTPLSSSPLSPRGLNEEESIAYLHSLRPSWSIPLLKRIVNFTFRSVER